MSRSVDVKIYNAEALNAALVAWGATNPELNRKILESCGTFIHLDYVIVNNEFYEDGSPYFNVATLFDWAYKQEDAFDVFIGWLDKGVKSREGISYANASELAEDLGIEEPEDDEDG